MGIKNAITATAKALTGSPTAAEIRDVRREAQARLTEVERRLEHVREGGHEHARIMREGSADELAKIEDEAKLLNAEERQLRTRLTELNHKQRHAEATEAVRDARALKDSLAKAAKEAEDAQAAYERARGAADRQVKVILQAVQACKRANVNPEPLLLDDAAIERAAALLDRSGRQSTGDVALELRRSIGGGPTKGRRRSEPQKGELVGGSNG